MMDFELKLEKPLLKTAWVEGLVMGISYFFGKTGGREERRGEERREM